MISRSHTITALLAAGALAVPAAAAPAGAATTVREYEGTVRSVDRGARTFRLDDAERGIVRVKVVASTRFERVTFAGLRRGLRGIEVTVRRVDGAWVAREVERSGGGGRHGGDDD